MNQALALRMLAPGPGGLPGPDPEVGGRRTQSRCTSSTATPTNSPEAASRTAVLVPVSGPQLGVDRDDTGRDDHRAVIVHRRRVKPTLSCRPHNRVRDVVSGDCREVMIDGAAHWLAQERPAEINKILVSFLAGSELT